MSKRNALRLEIDVQSVVKNDTVVGRLLLKVLNAIWSSPCVFFSHFTACCICSFTKAMACDGTNLDKDLCGSSNSSLGLK